MKVSFLSSLTAFSLLATTAWAQEPMLPQPKEKLSKADSLRIAREQTTSQITISAIRAEDQLPLSAVTIERKELKKVYAGQDMMLALQRTPGALTFSESGNYFGNYSYMRLRGLDQKRLNITLNGVPLNDMVSQGTYFSNMNDFGSSISGVQIQRGIGTGSFGIASLAGNLSFIGINPLRDTVLPNIQLTAGSYGTQRLAAEASAKIPGSNAALYVRFTNSNTDGYRRNSGSLAQSGFLSGSWQKDKLYVNLTAFTGRTNNKLSYEPALDSQLVIDRRFNVLGNDINDVSGQQLVQLQSAYTLNNQWRLSGSLYYQYAFSDYDYEWGNDIYVYGLKNRMLGGYAIANHSPDNTKWASYFGISGYHFLRDNRLSLDPRPSVYFYENQTLKREGSAFAKTSYLVTDKLKIATEAAVRSVYFDYLPDKDSADVFKAQTFLLPTLKLGLGFEQNEYLKWFASVAYTEREPTREDMMNGNDDMGAGLVAINGNLDRVKTEQLIDIEAGAELNWKGLKGQVNGFYMGFNNELAQTGKRSDNSFYNLRTNVAASYRYGVEGLLSYDFNHQWSLSESFTLMRAIITEFTDPFDGIARKNVNALLTPNAIANTALTYRPIKNLELVLNHRYQSMSYLGNNNLEEYSIASYNLWDARVAYQLNRHFNASLFVNNLTSADYYNGGNIALNYTTNTYQRARFVSAPRNFLMNVTITF